jgi:hypothetical protein
MWYVLGEAVFMVKMRVEEPIRFREGSNSLYIWHQSRRRLSDQQGRRDQGIVRREIRESFMWWNLPESRVSPFPPQGANDMAVNNLQGLWELAAVAKLGSKCVMCIHPFASYHNLDFCQ